MRWPRNGARVPVRPWHDIYLPATGSERVTIMDKKKPDTFRGTLHQWRAKKRRELRELHRAAEVVLYGSAYTPMRGTGVMLAQIEEWQRLASVKEWGR
jgi:hypothetical protein